MREVAVEMNEDACNTFTTSNMNTVRPIHKYQRLALSEAECQPHMHFSTITIDSATQSL